MTPAPEKRKQKKVKILAVTFDFELQRSHIPAFRGAMVEKVGRENLLFHNHLDNGSFLYGYPLIQYKLIRRNPAMLCIEHGSEEILKFFEKINWDLTIRGQRIETEIKNLSFDYFVCGFSPVPVPYRIYNWFALNEENFKRFAETKDETQRIDLLRRILIGNIISFAKGIGWNIDGEIELQIKWLPSTRAFSFKNHRMIGFDLDFTTNLLLPDFIGLGKSVARGFGMIERKKSWNR